uniref:Uncharacterized protein n=1 Tax=Hucho hucho TaxID=62062 RepID=A0A4W5R0B9_9TELE
MEERKVQLAHFILAALGEAEVNATIEEQQGLATGRTPMMCAGKLPRTADNTHFLRLLQARGAEVDRRGNKGRTTLSLASECSPFDAVHLLVLHGADPGSSDSQGRMSLAYAARCRHSAVVKTLCSASQEPERSMSATPNPTNHHRAQGKCPGVGSYLTG